MAPPSGATRSTPANDFENAREAIRASVGIYPNVAVIGAKAFSALKHHPKVTDRFKYVSKESITPDMIASLFELQKVMVGRAIYLDDNSNPVDIWVMTSSSPMCRSSRADPKTRATATPTP